VAVLLVIESAMWNPLSKRSVHTVVMLALFSRSTGTGVGSFVTTRCSGWIAKRLASDQQLKMVLQDRERTKGPMSVDGSRRGVIGLDQGSSIASGMVSLRRLS
jgi:hypothetical protein